eukprot:scaffold415_cov362-Prasinococcus_capsulatus_cf.AAC.9
MEPSAAVAAVAAAARGVCAPTRLRSAAAWGTCSRRRLRCLMLWWVLLTPWRRAPQFKRAPRSPGGTSQRRATPLLACGANQPAPSRGVPAGCRRRGRRRARKTSGSCGADGPV